MTKTMDHKDEIQSSSLPTTPLLPSSSSSSSDAAAATNDPSSTIFTTATTSNATTIHQGNQNMRSSSVEGGEEEEAEEEIPFAEELLRTVAKIVMILFGLSVVLTIFFWPSFLVPRLVSTIPTIANNKWMTTISMTLLIQLLHIGLLIYVDIHLYVHRFIALPIRIPLMPLLNVIVESEAKREKNATVWYNDCRTFPKITVVGNSHHSSNASSSDDALSTLLTGGFKASTRRDIKQKLRYYNERRVTSTTRHSNWLSLRNDIPLIWEHQAKQLRRRRRRRRERGQSLHGENPAGNDNNNNNNNTSNDNQSIPLGELLDAFLSRFLVIFLVPHAYIDRYYCPVDAVVGGEGETTTATTTTETDENRRQRLVAMGMFVACDHVLIYNMYFSVDDPVVNSAGVWQYNHIRGLLRAVISHNIGDDSGDDNDNGEEITNRINYINFFHHQDHAKKRVGALPAKPSNKTLMKELFPFALYREPPQNIIDVPMDLDRLLSKPGKRTRQK